MLTKEIREAINAERSAEYIRLLHNYGIWSRYFGCSGYPGHTSSNQTYTISDESAMIIDKAFCELKQKQPNLYKLLNMFYIQCKSPDEIFLILKKQNKEPINVDMKKDLLKVEHEEFYLKKKTSLFVLVM